MTIKAPIISAMELREVALGVGDILKTLETQAIHELINFVLHFEPKPLPGMQLSTVVAGEIKEIQLNDDRIDAEEFDVIRLNGRTYAPEFVRIGGVLHVAGNGNTLTSDITEAVARNLDDLAASKDQGTTEHGQLIDGARLIRFLTEVVLVELESDEGLLHCIGCGAHWPGEKLRIDDNGETGCEACFSGDGSGSCPLKDAQNANR